MTNRLEQVLEEHVARGTAPGALAAFGTADGPTEYIAAGDLPVDAIVRIQSMTKPVLAVATLRLVQAGRLRLEDSVEPWLPELANPRVLRTPESPLADTVPAHGPITIRHLLTNTSGFGMMTSPCPLQEAMIANGTQAGQEPLELGAQEWLDALSELPLAFQPGTGWRYHHSFGILGILLSRAASGSLEEHLRQDLFEPLGMGDTGYTVPRETAHRLPAAYRHDDGSELVEVEPAGAGFYVAPAPFDISHSELVSTARDYASFARMLAAGGRHDGHQFVEPELIAEMTADQVSAAAKTPESFFPGFWDGTGWGYGVSVQTSGPHAGRFGWSGGLGTTMHADPDGSFLVLLTQVEMGPEVMGLFAAVQ
ncbi:penicillin-binding protein [Kocuria polaris]|nr:penicillin-binding protein [Kocuria polaris]